MKPLILLAALTLSFAPAEAQSRLPRSSPAEQNYNDINRSLQRQEQNLHMHLILACFAGACVQVLRTLSSTRNQQSAAVSLCKVHVGTAGRPFRIRDYVLCGFSPFP